MELEVPNKNFFFNNYILDVFLFVTAIISLLITTIVMNILCKHKKLTTLVASLALQQRKSSVVTTQEKVKPAKSIECTCKNTVVHNLDVKYINFRSTTLCTLNSTYNEVTFNEKLAISKENLCTKYTPFTYKYITLNEKLPIMNQNLHIFFLLEVELSVIIKLRKLQLFRGYLFSNAVKIMLFISDTKYYVPIKLCKMAGSIHLFKIT